MRRVKNEERVHIQSSLLTDALVVNEKESVLVTQEQEKEEKRRINKLYLNQKE